MLVKKIIFVIHIYPKEHDRARHDCYNCHMDTLVHILEIIGIILGTLAVVLIILLSLFALWVRSKVRLLTKRFPGRGNIMGLVVIPFLNFLLEIFRVNSDGSEDADSEDDLTATTTKR